MSVLVRILLFISLSENEKLFETIACLGVIENQIIMCCVASVSNHNVQNNTHHTTSSFIFVTKYFEVSLTLASIKLQKVKNKKEHPWRIQVSSH